MSRPVCPPVCRDARDPGGQEAVYPSRRAVVSAR